MLILLIIKISTLIFHPVLREVWVLQNHLLKYPHVKFVNIYFPTLAGSVKGN